MRRTSTVPTRAPECLDAIETASYPVNANFNVRGRALVDKINGIRIEKIDDVIRAFESKAEGQHVIEFVGKQGFECLDRDEARTANATILKTYGVTNDRRL